LKGYKLNFIPTPIYWDKDYIDESKVHNENTRRIVEYV
jgi:hypothetical protein